MYLDDTHLSEFTILIVPLPLRLRLSALVPEKEEMKEAPETIYFRPPHLVNQCDALFSSCVSSFRALLNHT